MLVGQRGTGMARQREGGVEGNLINATDLVDILMVNSKLKPTFSGKLEVRSSESRAKRYRDG